MSLFPRSPASAAAVAAGLVGRLGGPGTGGWARRGRRARASGPEPVEVNDLSDVLESPDMQLINFQLDPWHVLGIEKASPLEIEMTDRFLASMRYFQKNPHQDQVLYEHPVGYLNFKPCTFLNDDMVIIESTAIPFMDGGPLTLYRSNKTYACPSFKINDEPVSFSDKDLLLYLTFINQEQKVETFLRKDHLFVSSDKYLMGLAFLYLKGADYPLEDINVTNFFGALMLANDMEEDDYGSTAVEEIINSSFMAWETGKNKEDFINSLRDSRQALFNLLQSNAFIDSPTVEQLMSIAPNHFIWRRTREIQDYNSNAPVVYCQSSLYLPVAPVQRLFQFGGHNFQLQARYYPLGQPNFNGALQPMPRGFVYGHGMQQYVQNGLVYTAAVPQSSLTGFNYGPGFSPAQSNGADNFREVPTIGQPQLDDLNEFPPLGQTRASHHRECPPLVQTRLNDLNEFPPIGQTGVIPSSGPPQVSYASAISQSGSSRSSSVAQVPGPNVQRLAGGPGPIRRRPRFRRQ